MPGALLGGVLVGVTEAWRLLFTPSAKSMFAFAILVLVLLFRPQGLLGKRLGMMARLSAGLSGRGAILLAALFVVFLAAPLSSTTYLLTVLTLIFYFAYAGQAWNIMMGFAGQLSLGTRSIWFRRLRRGNIVIRFGVSPWLGLLAAVPVAAACGAIIGILWLFAFASPASTSRS